MKTRRCLLRQLWMVKFDFHSDDTQMMDGVILSEAFDILKQ